MDFVNFLASSSLMLEISLLLVAFCDMAQKNNCYCLAINSCYWGIDLHELESCLAVIQFQRY